MLISNLPFLPSNPLSALQAKFDPSKPANPGASHEPVDRYEKISTGEFFREMCGLGIGRGLRSMKQGFADNPLLSLAAGSGTVFLGTRPWKICKILVGDILVGAGLLTAGYYTANGSYRGYCAWQKNDRTGLREASVDFGIGVSCLVAGGLGYKIGKWATNHELTSSLSGFQNTRLAKVLTDHPRLTLALAAGAHCPDELAAAGVVSQSLIEKIKSKFGKTSQARTKI